MAEITVTQSASQIMASRAGYDRRKLVNRIMLTITGLLTALALIPLFWVILYVVFKGLPYLNWDFFTNLPRPLGVEGGGVLPSIQGTLILTLLAGFFSIPPGVMAGIYAAYHPNTRLGVVVRFSTDVLSGIPSIIIGLLGYALLVKPIGNYSALAGGIALAVLMFPIIIRTTEEMIKLVPHTLREASLGLGAPEWKTTLSVTLVAASSGIITGILLGLARASGETAPLLFTALGNEQYEIGSIVSGTLQNGGGPLEVLQKVLLQPVDSLPLTLYKYSQQPYPERVNQAWAIALILMGLILAVNLGARWFITRQASTLKGK
jgi:phosphate transport system permease protein